MTTATATASAPAKGEGVQRNGLLLLTSAAVTSVLGLGYWLVAAHVLEADALGRGSALLSAVLLVTSVGTAGLKRGLIRFVPAAGTGAPHLVRRVYAIGLVAMLVVGTAVAGWFAWSGDDVMPASGAMGLVAFFGAVAIWGIFVLQDAALIGARRTALVPITNTIFSVLKIAALVVVASGGRSWGLLASWIIPAAAIAIVVNAWLFRVGFRTRPGEEASTAAAAAPPGWRTLLQFTGAEYTGTLLWHASMHLTPLIIVVRAGDAATASWYIAYQIAYAVFVVSSNVCDALVAEGARDGQLRRHLRHACRLIGLLLVPAVAVVAVGAPWIMGAFGATYADDATAVLRLLALAAIPNAISTIVIAVGHIHRRMHMVVTIQATMAVSTLLATWLLVDRGGIATVALGWLAAQTVTAVVAISLVLFGDADLRTSARTSAVDLAAGLRSGRDRKRAERMVRTIVGQLPPGTVPPGPATVLSHQHDLLVASVGAEGSRVILHLARARSSRRLVAAQRDVLDELQADARLDELRPLLPRAATFDPDLAWMVQPASPGRPATSFGLDQWATSRAAGLVFLDELHRSTAEPAIISDSLLDGWVHQRVIQVAETLRDPEAARGLAVLHDRLTIELLGRPVTVARLHGDPSPDNFLLDEEGSEVNAVVDWEATTTGLPECDLAAFLLACRRHAHRRELGDDVVEILRNGWTAEEAEALGPNWSTNAHVRPTTFVLLAWLHHVAANLEKAGRYGRNRWWLHANVDRVLRELAADDPVGAKATAESVASRTTGRLGVQLDESTPQAPVGPASEPTHTTAARRLTLPTLRWATVVATLVSGLAWLADAPSTLRAIPVVLAVVVLPTMVLARALAVDSALVRFVVGAGGIVATNVMVSEVLLYTGRSSPGIHLVAMAIITLSISFLVPRYTAAVPPAPSPPVQIGRTRDRTEVPLEADA